MWKKDNSFEVKKMLDAQKAKAAELVEERSEKTKELKAIEAAIKNTDEEITRLDKLFEENYEYFCESLDRYCQHLMKRIWQKDAALEMLENVFIRRATSGYEFYYERLFVVGKDERDGEFYPVYDDDNRSYLRSSDRRLETLERAIIGEDGVLIYEKDSSMDANESMYLLAYFYHEAKKKDLPAIIARVKEEIEKADWKEVMKPGERNVRRYLFHLYFTPRDT